jgi:membrane protease YdiL (CAAX protease family)
MAAITAAAAVIVYGVWYSISFGLLRPDQLDVGDGLFDVLTRLVLPFAVLFALHKLARVRSADYWLSSPFADRTGAQVVALGFICTLALLTYIPFANLVSPREALLPQDSIEHPRQLGFYGALALALYLSATASFSEEVFFRALPRLIMVGTGVPFGTTMYVFASSALFGLLHMPYGSYSVVSTSYFGLVAALLFVRTNNLWYPLAGHFLADLIVILWRYERYGVM